MIVAGSQTVCEGNIFHLWLAKVGLAATGNLSLVMLILFFSHLFWFVFLFFLYLDSVKNVAWSCISYQQLLLLTYCGRPRRWNALSGSLCISSLRHHFSISQMLVLLIVLPSLPCGQPIAVVSFVLLLHYL